MKNRSIVGGLLGMRIAMAALLTLGLTFAATAEVVIGSSQPAAAASCPTIESGPGGLPVPVPGPSAGVDWSGCNLSGAYITAGDLSDANLSGADLSGTQLWGTDLIDADLSDANLTSAWVGGRCAGDEFSDDGADLYGANLTDANFTSANLGGEFGYYGSEQCVVYGAELNDSTITGADLTGAELIGVTSGDMTGQPASLPIQWLFDNGTLYGPGATCSRASGKATISFKSCLWTIMNPVTSTPSASIHESSLSNGGNLTWKIAHPQVGRARQTSVVSLASLSSPGQGICPSGFTEQDFSGILSSGFDAGDAMTAQLCQKTKTGSFELAPGTTAGL
jgi:uncharacterized protein YjbI with pentapeptide repeats